MYTLEYESDITPIDDSIYPLNNCDLHPDLSERKLNNLVKLGPMPYKQHPLIRHNVRAINKAPNPFECSWDTYFDLTVTYIKDDYLQGSMAEGYNRSFSLDARNTSYLVFLSHLGLSDAKI